MGYISKLKEELKDTGEQLKNYVDSISLGLAPIQIADSPYLFAYGIHQIPPHDHLTTGNIPLDLGLKILAAYGLSKMLVYALRNIDC